MQLLDTKIEYVDKVTGDVWLRSFGLTDNVVAQNGRFHWMTHSSDQDIHTFKNQDVILTPTMDHIIVPESWELWNQAQKPFSIGIIEEIVNNAKTKAHDFIWRTTDPRAAEAAKAGHFSRFKVSPAIWSDKFHVDNDGVVHYKNYRGVHLAIVKNGAFPDELAVINDHVCVGGSKCKNELAAIASFTDSVLDKSWHGNYDPFEILQKNITLLIPPTDKTNDNNKMGEGDKTVSYEDHYKLKSLYEQTEQKYKDALEVNKTLATDKETATKRADTAESQLGERIEKDKRAEFKEFFTVIHGKEAEDKVNTAVESAITRKYERKDLDELYGTIYEQKKAEIDAKAKEEAETNNSGLVAGVGSGTSKSNSNTSTSKDLNAAVASARNERREGAEVALGLFRRRY